MMKVNGENKISAEKVFITFLIVSIMGYLITVIRLFVTRGECFYEIFDAAGYNAQMDMIMHLVFVNTPREVYFSNTMACFPPFAYIFYYFVNRIMPVNEQPTLNDYRQNPFFLLFYIMLIVICCILLNEEIKMVLKTKMNQTLGLVFLILLSEPFWAGVIERGNSVFFALLLLIPALVWRESESSIKKEIALLMIAMSAGLKLYPAIFGLLYLREKRYKEAGRLVAYGCTIGFVPFLFFGGMRGLKQFLYNLGQVKNEMPNLHTIQNFIFFLNLKIRNQEMVSGRLYMLSAGIAFMIGVILLVLSYFCQKKWTQYLFLTTIMVVVVPSSYPYTTIYLIIPFLYFLMEESGRLEECIIAVLWGGIFTMAAVPSSWFVQLFGYSYCFESRYIYLAMIVIYAIVSECKIMWNKGANK